MDLESLPKSKTPEVKKAANALEALNVGRYPLNEVVGVIKGLQKGAVVDLFKHNNSPEEVAEAFKSYGLIVDIDRNAKVNDKSTARLIVSKDQAIVDQLKSFKAGPETPVLYESIVGTPVDKGGEFLKDDFPGIYSFLQDYKEILEKEKENKQKSWF